MVVALLSCGAAAFADGGVGTAALSETARYNTIAGVQTIGSSYQFTNETKLLETARVILGLGSHVIKFTLAPDKGASGLKPASLVELVQTDPSIKAVFAMPFANYVLWTYPQGNGSEYDLAANRRQIYDLTQYLLRTYNGTGKKFYLGNWEGDWILLHANDKHVPTDEELTGITNWFNVRQKAVDDARRDTPHKDVEVYHYVEVNRVRDAMDKGLPRLSNRVIAKVNSDFVSYSSYDSISGDDREARLKSSLDYIQSQLPPKPGLPSRRVFIGEFGFSRAKAWTQATGLIFRTPQEQEELSRQILRAAVEWGCPFVLYWELYNNEVDKDGTQKGFWLIDDKNVKQPVYDLFARYYAQSDQWVTAYKKAHGHFPAQAEFSAKAVDWLAPGAARR